MKPAALVLVLVSVGCGKTETPPATAAPDAVVDAGTVADSGPTADAGSDGVGDPDVLDPENGEGTFPPGFLWGTATAGFQVDMGCPTLPKAECEDPNSDWYQFVMSDAMRKDSSNHLAGHDLSMSPGHWELFEQDFDRAKNELHNNGFRMSLEWSRIFPKPTDGAEGYEALSKLANEAAVIHYHDVFEALKNRGIKPLVTLNHYTLPSWIHDGVACHLDLKTCKNKGWVDRERTVKEIAKFAGFCAQEFGGEVDLWATENEPFAVLFPGYIFPSPDRVNPPAISALVDGGASARIVFQALIEAHARMYDAIKAGDTADADADGKAAVVGVVYSMAPVRPKDPTKEADKKAAENVFYLWNMAFLNAVAKGIFDGDLDGKGELRADLQGRMDYIGVNYYTRIGVEGADTAILPGLSPLTTFNPLTLEPWENYPKGIYEMVMKVKELGLPTIITENGTSATDDEGKVLVKWIVENLTWLSRAITDGAQVDGYFVWSLMDNYEWNHGMSMQFGLYGVDPKDPKKPRVARQAATVYGRIAKDGRIPKDLLDAYPVPD